MKTSKFSWPGFLVGIVIGVALFFAFAMLVVPNWSVFP